MKKQAWQLEREMRDAAVPVDRRKEASHWIKADMEFPHGDELLRWFWNVNVPGSSAPDVFFQGMVQDWGNQGYDVSEAEALIPEGRALEAANNLTDLRVVSARIMKALREAPKIEGHPYHRYEHPATWYEIMAAMPAARGYRPLSVGKSPMLCGFYRAGSVSWLEDRLARPSKATPAPKSRASMARFAGTSRSPRP